LKKDEPISVVFGTNITQLATKWHSLYLLLDAI